MVIIKKVVFLHTPYHYKSINDVNPNLFNNESTLIFKAKYLSLCDISAQEITFDNTLFSKRNFLREPLRSINTTKQKIGAVDSFLKMPSSEFKLADKIDVYVGNDKDIFVQRFLKIFKVRIRQVVAVDEGLAYYVRLSMKDKLYKILYPIFSKILFGKSIFYIKRFGTHPMVSKVYLRDIKLLRQKYPRITYIPVNNGYNSPKIETIKKGRILIFSFPEQDLGIKPEKKIEILNEIITYYQYRNIKVFIKPHPREDVNLLQNKFTTLPHVRVLNQSSLGEMLKYEDFELIINFFSSVILDLICRGYPRKKILTIGFTPRPQINFEELLNYHYFNRFNFKRAIEGVKS